MTFRKVKPIPTSWGQKIAWTTLIFGIKVSLPASEGHAIHISDIDDDSPDIRKVSINK
jgi:hypothetical protein